MTFQHEEKEPFFFFPPYTISSTTCYQDKKVSNGQLRHVLYNNQSGEENRNRAETFIKVITKEVCSLVLLAMPMEEKQRETQKVCASGEQGNDGQRGLAEKQKEEEKATESNRRGKMDRFCTVQTSTIQEKQPGFLPLESFLERKNDPLSRIIDVYFKTCHVKKKTKTTKGNQKNLASDIAL